MDENLPHNSDIQDRKKRNWLAVLKCLFFKALPFLFIAVLVLLGIYIWNNDQNKTDPDLIPDTVVTDNEVRWQALTDNWKQYYNRGDQHILAEERINFELTYCPFSYPNTWDYDISAEEAGMICGNIIVPLYHEHPEQGSIHIPIAIWPARELPTYSDPLFISQGGPGGSTLDMYPFMFYSLEFKGQRDIVFVDQRGSRYAKPALLCPEEDEDDESTDEYASLRSCRSQLADEGIDLAAFTRV